MSDYRPSEAAENSAYLETQKRKCHDCGRPTWNYRCAKCKAKHDKKHGVSSTATDHMEE